MGDNNDDSKLVFGIGSRVVLTGLVKLPQYNGKVGIVKSALDSKTGRQSVSLVEDNHMMALKPSNLQLEARPLDSLSVKELKSLQSKHAGKESKELIGMEKADLRTLVAQTVSQDAEELTQRLVATSASTNSNNPMSKGKKQQQVQHMSNMPPDQLRQQAQTMRTMNANTLRSMNPQLAHLTDAQIQKTASKMERMANNPSNEIIVALIGYVSAGKTTVLNAIFGDKYGEVSMRRTTAAVNYFRISPSLHKGREEQADKQTKKFGSNHQRSVSLDDDPSHPKDVLEEITRDNAALRNLSTVHEKHFDIELKETLFEMHENTKLVLVDIPGINEAGSSSKYKDYVRGKWHTFDCVLVVMDGRQGVNTDEQMDLLSLVKENQKIRELPVIFLCNKIDVPEDVEQQVLVQEAREAIEKGFNLSNSQATLKHVLSATKQRMEASKPDLLEDLFAPKPATPNETQLLKKPYPLFITISAIHAFIYQSASIMPFEDFQKFDDDLIERFGRDYFGRKWRQLDKSKQYAEAYKVLKDPEECKVGLELSNFDKFLGALDFTVGGKKRQLSLLRAKLEYTTMRLIGNETLVADLEQIVLQRKSLKLDQEVDDLHSKFWSLFEEAEAGAFVKFENPTKVGSLAVPMTMLIDYHGLCTTFEWRKECELVVSAMEKLLRHQFSFIFEKQRKWNEQIWFKAAQDKQQFTFGCNEQTKINEHALQDVAHWEDLSPKGWETLLALLLIDERPFLIKFGYEKIALESMLFQFRGQLQTNCWGPDCPDCHGELRVMCRKCSLTHSWSYLQNGLCQTSSCQFLDPKFYQCSRCNKYFHPTPSSANGRRCPLRGCVLTNNGRSNNYCSSCGISTSEKWIGTVFESQLTLEYKDGAWTPVNPDFYNRYNGIPMPKDGVSHPDHFGHLLWQFCWFMEDKESQ